MDDTSPSRPPSSGVAPVVGLATVICALLCGYWFLVVVGAPDPGAAPSGDLISTVYDPPSTSVEAALVRGDGQIFAAQAMDPTLARPDAVAGGPKEQAYRFQRPLYGWIGWAASAGQARAAAIALVVATAASVVALIAVTASWLARAGADPRWALALLAAPGVFVDLTWVGPEALGTALVVWGLARWFQRSTDPARPTLVPASVDVAALVAFGLAGLTRESLLVVPAVLGVAALVRRRWSVAGALVATAVPYVAWVVVVHARVGAWPEGAVPGRVSGVPLGGLVGAWGGWGPGDWCFAVATIALAVVALVVGRGSPLRPLIAVNLVLAALLGEPVWARFADFGRVLLPLTALSLLVVVPELTRRRAGAQAGTPASAEGPAADAAGGSRSGLDVPAAALG